jgi:hypothetical protein
MRQVTSSGSQKPTDTDTTGSSSWVDRLVFGSAAALFAFSLTDPGPIQNPPDSPLIQREGKLGDRLITTERSLSQCEHAVERVLSEGMPTNLSDRRALIDEILAQASILSECGSSLTLYAQAGRFERSESRKPFERLAACLSGFQGHVRVLNEQSYMLSGQNDFLRHASEYMKKDIVDAKLALAELERKILD